MRFALAATICPLFALLFWAESSFAADTPVPTAVGPRIKGYIEYLASDDLGGRQTCTDGYRRAADWVASRFEEWGLKPAGVDGSWFQEVEIRDFEIKTGVPSLSVAGREFFLDDDDFSVGSVCTVGTTIDAEAVFVGYGISAPDAGLDEYDGIDVKGRVVVAFKGSPAGAPKARSFFGGSGGTEKEESKDKWQKESTDAAKTRTAYDKGAAAILLYNPDSESEDGRSSWSRRRSREKEVEPERDFLRFSIEQRVFRSIMKEGDQESSRGLARRMDQVRRDIQAGKPRSRATGVALRLEGYESTIKHDEKNGNNKARNVLARIEGTDPDLKNQYVIIGAHLDHVGARNGYIYNGADDNASGAAVVMEVGRVLAESGFQPKRTVIIACWCGEEMGLLGSRHFTENPCGGVEMDRVVAYFNADMVGSGEKIGAPGALNFPEIWEVIQRDQDPEIMKIVEARTGGPGGSDHSGFITEGIEALALMTSGGVGHPDYHQPEDDAAKMDPEILGKTAQFMTQAVRNLASETEVNLLIENRRQVYESTRIQFELFNPALEGSLWRVQKLEAKNAAELEAKIVEEALTLLDDRRAGKEPPEGSTTPSPSVATGIDDLSLFQGDLKMLERASRFYGFGRLDIKGDDGVWIKEGKLTDAGREALKAIEEKGLVIHLISPKEELLQGFLSAAAKPFLVTGEFEITEAMSDRVVEKGVVLGVHLDPKDVAGFLDRLTRLKDRIGKRELLVAWVTAKEGLEDARRPFYLGLLEKGWAPREINGTRRQWGGITGGNMQGIGAKQARRRRG